jgi:hypothetical protein
MIAVIPSVNYADMLAVTLPAWKAAVPRATLRVVTSRQDIETHRVCRAAGVEALQTDAWKADGARLNAARALDEAFTVAAPGEICLSIDADCYPFGVFPTEDAIAPGVLYGCARYLCRSTTELRAHLNGLTRRETLPLMGHHLEWFGYGLVANTPEAVARLAAEGPGYFKVWRYGAERFGSYATAGAYDTHFAAKFANKRPLVDCYVLHLGPSRGKNWAGRLVPQWETA